MRIKLVKELPQWIRSSNIAAYVPSTRTIWLKRDVGHIRLIKNFFHEVGHHLIEIFTKSKKIHFMYDNIWKKLGI